MIAKIFISLYWTILLIHNYKNLKNQGLIPYLFIVNGLVLISLFFGI